MPSPGPVAQAELNAPAPVRRRRGLPAWVGVGVPLLVGLVHVALVAPHYHVGSFDDDASYVLTAKALLAGHGLTGHVASGQVVAGLYPPGYSALLAPLLWIWPHSFLPLRLLSAGCYAAVFPLTWVWLARHRVGPAVRTAVLTVLALGPPFATYGSMVMAEAPFLVVLLLLLLAVDRWRHDVRAASATGLAVVALAAGLVWLKEAGIGLVAGLVVWLALGRIRRGRYKAAVVAAGVAASLVPVLVARLVAGIPLAGARYSQELGGYYHGGLVNRLVDVVPHSTWHLLATAIPATLVPYLEPLPIRGAWADTWKLVSWHVTLLAAVGAVRWARRHRDALVPMTVVYLGECVLWPFINERRAILVLPVLVTWYVTGAAEVWALLRRSATRPGTVTALRTGGVALSALAVAVPLVAQMPRDYLYPWGRSGSHFGGSRYADVLRHLGRPSDVVETDYRSSTALFTGHATNWNAFIHDQGAACSEATVRQYLAADRAAFLLVGDVNKPGVLDSPCLRSQAQLSSWAVEILHTARDDATVYELTGPGTGNPDLTSLLSAALPARYSAGGQQATLTWSLAAPAPVSQMSVGTAAAGVGPTTGVRMELQRPDGTWLTVDAARAGVGDGPGRAPYLLSALGAPVEAVGLRVVVDGPDAASGATITNVAVLGPRPGGA